VVACRLLDQLDCPAFREHSQGIGIQKHSFAQIELPRDATRNLYNLRGCHAHLLCAPERDRARSRIMRVRASDLPLKSGITRALLRLLAELCARNQFNKEHPQDKPRKSFVQNRLLPRITHCPVL
jgi:hypothetical protein